MSFRNFILNHRDTCILFHMCIVWFPTSTLDSLWIEVGLTSEILSLLELLLENFIHFSISEQQFSLPWFPQLEKHVLDSPWTRKPQISILTPSNCIYSKLNSPIYLFLPISSAFGFFFFNYISILWLFSVGFHLTILFQNYQSLAMTRQGTHVLSLVWCIFKPRASLVAQMVRNLPANKRPEFNPWSGKSPGVGNGYPLPYSYLENFMDRGAWRPGVQWVTKTHGVAKSQTKLSD